MSNYKSHYAVYRLCIEVLTTYPLVVIKTPEIPFFHYNILAITSSSYQLVKLKHSLNLVVRSVEEVQTQNASDA